MSNLYVRIKGRVQGPFDLETLQGMVQRGQLSRIHQVSEDGEVWKKATEYGELFKSNTRSAETVRAEQVSGQSSTSRDSNAGAGQPAAPQSIEAEWHVEDNGAPSGPFSFAELQKMFRSGKFEPSNFVWREGMSDWVPADTVDGLVNTASLFARHSGQQSLKQKQNDAIDPLTISILNESRGWVILCGVVLVLGSVFEVVIAFILLVQGIRQNSDVGIVSSIVSFAFAFVFAFGAWVNFAYSSSLVKLRIDKDVASLHSSLKRLNRIWTFVGLFLILVILLFVVMFVLRITVPDYFFNYWINVLRQLHLEWLN